MNRRYECASCNGDCLEKDISYEYLDNPNGSGGYVCKDCDDGEKA